MASDDDQKNRLQCTLSVTQDSNHPPTSSALPELAASLRFFAESMARTELAELEMLKAREAARREAEKRRMETEAEMTRMILQTQLQMASVLAGKGVGGRKRKRVDQDHDEPPVSVRGGALLLSLLQCNFHL